MFRYCGEYFDKETGTIYLRARYYDPEIGRFITEDSYWGKDNEPLSLNLYTYCYSNPINRFDPSGHISQEDAMRISDQLNALGAKSDGVVTQQEAEQIHRIQITSAPKTTQGAGNSGTNSNNKTTTNNKTNPIVKALTGSMPDLTVQYGITLTRVNILGFTGSLQLEHTEDNNGAQAWSATVTYGLQGDKEKKSLLPSFSPPAANFGIFTGEVHNWEYGGKNTGITVPVMFGGIDYAESGKFKGIQVSGGGKPEAHIEDAYTWMFYGHNKRDDGMFDGTN